MELSELRPTSMSAQAASLRTGLAGLAHKPVLTLPENGGRIERSGRPTLKNHGRVELDGRLALKDYRRIERDRRLTFKPRVSPNQSKSTNWSGRIKLLHHGF